VIVEVNHVKPKAGKQARTLLGARGAGHKNSAWQAQWRCRPVEYCTEGIERVRFVFEKERGIETAASISADCRQRRTAGPCTYLASPNNRIPAVTVARKEKMKCLKPSFEGFNA
jgi:hypothetical protein